MTAIVITGVALASALGPTAQSSWHRLLAGESGIKLAQPFAELPPRPLGLLQTDPGQNLELISTLLQALLTDANLSGPLPHCGVVIGSSRGLQYQWEAWLRQRALSNSPGLESWWQSLPQGLALNVAATIQTQAPVLAPNAACATGIWTIALGKLLIESGQCHQVIVGASETPVTPLTLAGFSRMGALCHTGAYPFDQHREGFALAEGGALLLLETETAAINRQAKIYGQLLGVGLTADASHLTSPDHHAQGMVQAVKQCLTQAQCLPQDLDHIHAHGTGTQLNDQAEAQWIKALGCGAIPISSSKGATGHTLGAAGAMATIFSLLALRDQTIFPTVGLTTPAFDLNLVRTPQAWDLKTVLCCSYGFGGQNAVAALKHWPGGNSTGN